MRVFDAGPKQAPGLHELMTGLVDRRGCVINGAHDGVTVGHLSHERKVLVDGNARNVRGDGLEGAPDIRRRSGLGSHVSSWLGPPTRNRMMQLVSLRWAFSAA